MGISIWQLLIILVIVVVLFGTKKLKNIGGDLGGAIKNFRQSLRDGEESATKPETTAAKPETVATPESAAKPETATTPQPAAQMTQEDKGKIIEGQVTDKQTSKV